MVSESSSGHEDNTKDNNSQKQRRGAYILKKIDKLTKVGRIPMSWNDLGQPNGDYTSLFQQFIGFHVRARVSISIPKWKAVPNELKLLIFDAVKEKFDVDESHSELIIASARKKWSDFKSSLSTTYMYSSKDKSQIRSDPPSEFPFIDKNTWAEFLGQRCTSEFQEVSEKNSGKAKLNKYVYRRARMSYARLEQELLKKLGLDPKTTLPRWHLWVAARETDGKYDPEVMKIVKNLIVLKEQVAEGKISPEGREDLLSIALGNGEHSGRIRGVGPGVGVKYFGGRRGRNAFIDPRVNELQETVNTLTQRDIDREKQMKALVEEHEAFRTYVKELHGSDTHLPTDTHGLDINCSIRNSTISNNDPKAPTLHTEIHKGGIAQQSTIAAEPSDPKLHTEIHKGGIAHKSTIAAELSGLPTSSDNDPELQHELHNGGVAQQSEIAAKPSGPPTSSDKEILRKCQLYWPKLYRKVAIGRAYVSAPGVVQLLYFKPLGKENIKVQVDTPLHPDEGLPFPTEETVVVKDAIGTPVAWPKELVVFGSDGVQESSGKKPSPPPSRIDKDKNPQKPHQKSTTLDKYHLLCPTLSAGFVKEMEVSDQLGLHFPQSIYIQIEHLEDITLGKKPIDSIHIAFYMKYLCETRASDKYPFLCPTYLSNDYLDGDQKQHVLFKQQYIANSMTKEGMKNRIWFLAYHERFHWMLVVINPISKMIYWLDPLGGNVRHEFKAFLDTAISIASTLMGEKRRNKFRWVNISCPRQPNNVECGLYVCRFLREIMDHNSTSVVPVTISLFFNNKLSMNFLHIFQIQRTSMTTKLLMRYERNGCNI